MDPVYEMILRAYSGILRQGELPLPSKEVSR